MSFLDVIPGNVMVQLLVPVVISQGIGYSRWAEGGEGRVGQKQICCHS